MTDPNSVPSVSFILTTVDARNPAPVDMVNSPLFTGFYTSQVVVWDFFHQQYHWTFSRNKTSSSLFFDGFVVVRLTKIEQKCEVFGGSIFS